MHPLMLNLIMQLLCAYMQWMTVYATKTSKIYNVLHKQYLYLVIIY